MRQSSNFRSTLRARPHTRHRRTVRVMNFGFRAALIRIARLAIYGSSNIPWFRIHLPNGIPSPFRSSRARSSRPAVVTIVTFKPFDLSVFA